MKWSKVTDGMLSVIPKRYEDKKVSAKLKKASFQVMVQNNFTVVLLRVNRTYVVGVAKRNPRDAWNAAAAGNIAFVRAYRNFVEVENEQ